MSSKHLKRGLIYATYCLIGFFAIPYVLNHYGVSYTLTTAVLHILILILLVYTLYQYRQLDGVHEINQKYKESRQKLLLRENELNSLFDNNNAYLWTIDFAEKTFLPSQGFEQVYGFSRDEFMKNYELWKDRVIPEDMHIAEEHYARLKSGLPSNRAFRFRNGNEEIRWLDAWGKPIFNEKNKVTHLTGVAYDITDRKELEEKLYHNATHDYLTGLPNRKKLLQHMEDEMTKCSEKKESLAVLFLDLDHFKFVNDSYGHNVGDRLLVQIGERLNSFVGKKGMVFRHGGDEFIVIMRYQSYKQFINVVHGLIETFKTPYDLNVEHSTISASIGVSMFPKDDTTIEGLIGKADRAMYRAKEQGKNTYRFANPDLEEAEARRNNVEKHLKKAMDLNELEVHYQPIVDMKTGQIFGVEAFIYWDNPDLGKVKPSEFIPLAERLGIMSEIGLWVIDTATKQMKAWHKKGLDFRLSVNVSTAQFEDPLFSRKLNTTLGNNHFKPDMLTLDIPESVLQNTEKASKTIRHLRHMGIEVAIDDFGTGYSSLSVLNAVPIDTIKIDETFLKDVPENEHNGQIINTIISLGHTLNSKVIAEGVETTKQVTFLNKAGCEYGQGCKYSHPESAVEIEKLLLQQSA
ncbi:putative bifunctional diguanylate cyclase/phosphodiesterase [Alkalibacterium indicireducens]|uniref:PAS domain S-box-containing protein/diguanylate cyclase (GGDEF) domain-containing protein n=1 Tax=Alkalibacterium indicireducens TaxID=398758 RepID=A0ABP3KJ71_9LACT